jgi:hypothetical protein
VETRLEGPPLHRISVDRVLSIVQAAQHKGASLNADAFDRALLLLGDMPGVRADSGNTAGIAALTNSLDGTVAIAIHSLPSVSSSGKGCQSTVTDHGKHCPLPAGSNPIDGKPQPPKGMA